MLGLIDEFQAAFDEKGLTCVPAKTSQVLTEQQLIETLPDFEAWIIGDDPASRRVVEAGKKGRLRAAVKWGVGVDNVDFEAFSQFGIPVENTPGVFGEEVADVALTYTLGLARETYLIDRKIRTENAWPKPSGISVNGRKVAIVGLGDIGRATARRISACGADILAYDPAFQPMNVPYGTISNPSWPDRLEEADFLIFTCPLNPATRGMFNEKILKRLKPGVRVINVGRGPVIEEAALLKGLESGVVHSAALDVFEVEPLPSDSPLRDYERCIFGSHNGSNSADAVRKVSLIAIEKIAEFLSA